jgi:hypothetical protein
VSNTARLDLARELHDGIAQDLVALGYELDLLLANSATSICPAVGTFPDTLDRLCLIFVAISSSYLGWVKTFVALGQDITIAR